MMKDFTIAGGPTIRCEISAVVYVNGEHYAKLPLDWYIANEESSGSYNVWIGYDGEEKVLNILCLTPSGEYICHNAFVDLSEMLTDEVYAGFIGSVGDSGSINEILSWHFRNDLNIFDRVIIDVDTALLEDYLELLEGSPVDLTYLPQYG